VQQDAPANVGGQKTAAADRRYSTADGRSRARKGAENLIQTLEAGSARPTAARSGVRALP